MINKSFILKYVVFQSICLLFLIGRFGLSFECLLYGVTSAGLVILSLMDLETYEIPFWINVCIFSIGVLHICMDLPHWSTYLIGFFAVSLPLELILILTKGEGIGGGDVKLMATAGILLGWKLILVAFVIACVLGSIFHIIRMKCFHADRRLAMGPYLSAGIMISLLFGDLIIQWYVHSILGI